MSPREEVLTTQASAPANEASREESYEDSKEPNEATAMAPYSPPPPRSQPLAQNVAGGQPADGKTDATVSESIEKEARKVHGQRSPILIYTANFQMAVFEVANSLAEVERIAREVGGFVTKRTDRQITARVPAARFYETVGRLEKLGDVIQRDVTAQDVTEEYLDTEVRLRNARAMRDRLEQLLAKANTVQDSLMIERELNRIAAEIERMEGRLKFLRDRAAYSTITVSFDPKQVVTPPPAVRLPFPWLTSHSLARLLSL
ncbi:MAG: DUF4349 domain-containing protein [Polyangiaceae bacterium]|nr:DUF4349 domain-containing protein [Polyangiaceae bacterium]